MGCHCALRREAWDGHHGGRFERGGKDVDRNDCSVFDGAQYNSGPIHGSSLWVDFLACKPGDGCVLLVHAQGADHPKMEKVGDFNIGAEIPWTTDVWAVERRSLGRSVSERWCPQSTNRPRVTFKPTVTHCTAETCEVHWTRCVAHWVGRC